jgi:hypothetical protein
MMTSAVLGALERQGTDIGDEPQWYRSPWRAAGLAEGVERAPSACVWPGYSARSLRSTRGAPRA